MDDTGVWAYRWQARTRNWFLQGGGLPVLVLVPLAALFAFLSPVSPVSAWVFGASGIS